MAEWIWFPGEFEHKYVCEVSMRKYKRDVLTMPIWKVAPIYQYVRFVKTYILEKDEEFIVRADGKITVESNGRNRFVPFIDGKYRLKAGEHKLSISVYANPGKICTIFVQGNTIKSGKDWECTLQDNLFFPVGYGGFRDIEKSPNNYSLPLIKQQYVSKTVYNSYTLYDFGKETFGYIFAEGGNGKGKLNLYYGESEEEASDFQYCELIDSLYLNEGESRTQITKAFRYVAVEAVEGAQYSDIYMLYEYKPQPLRPKVNFKDTLMQKIWDVSLYTLELNTREFFLDGIKRDRWVWSGDATQSYLMNWYSFFDEETARRTQVALSGKGCMTQHINTIVDYTLFWLISFYDHYHYTGDKEFLSLWYFRFEEIVEYVLSCTDSNYRIIKRPGDWVFIDWGKGLTKDSDSYSFLQILFYQAMKSAALVSRIAGKDNNFEKYSCIAQKIYDDLQNNYYSPEHKAFIYSIKDGVPDGVVLRQPNIMAVLYDAANEKQKKDILDNVINNDKIPALETPYMRFYELSAMCELGDYGNVYQQMISYWGGMLDEGATTFWELYRPEEKGLERYSMYNCKYGKSLCHAWGASPIYILGRYFIGLTPEGDGYSKYKLKPNINYLGDFNIEFNIKGGKVNIVRSGDNLTVQSPTHDGVIELNDAIHNIKQGETFTVLLYNA